MRAFMVLCAAGIVAVLIWAGLWPFAGLPLIGVAVAANRWRRPPENLSWTVEVGPATSLKADYYGRYPDRPTRVEGETAVRLRRGKDTHPIGVIKVTADDFDDRLAALRHKAEERATTLNAVEDGLA